MVSSPEILDVVVVGSGPAGSSTALELCSHGASVALLERARFPRYKTCGGGVVGRALTWLPFNGRPEPHRVCRAIQLNLSDGSRYVVHRPDPVVVMMMRSELDQALANAARDAGADLRQECAFEGVSREGDTLRVATSRGTLRARFLIGADGALGKVAPASGWRNGTDSIPALECELEVGAETLKRFTSGARFDFGIPDDGYGWVFPKRSHLSVGVLSMRRGRARLRVLLREYLRRVGLTDARNADVRGYVIPVRPRTNGFARGRTLLVGDAAGLADPITAEGISYAIRSGRLAADAWRRGGGEPAKVRSLYTAGLDKHVLPELRFGRIVSRVLYQHPRLRALAFRRSGQLLCEGVTDVMLGRRSYADLLSRPGTYLKLLLGRLAAPYRSVPRPPTGPVPSDDPPPGGRRLRT